MFTSSFLQTPFRGNQHETIISDRYRCRGFGPGGTEARGADYSQLIWGSASSLSFEDANGDAALAAYSEMIIAALHPGVTEGQVQTDFGAGNVSKILTQDFDVYNWAPLGWSSGFGRAAHVRGRVRGFWPDGARRPGQRGNGHCRQQHHDDQLLQEQADLLPGDRWHLLLPGNSANVRHAGVYRAQRHHRNGDLGTDSGSGTVHLFPAGTAATTNGSYASDLSDPGYYAVVGQYGFNAGPDFQNVLNGLAPATRGPWRNLRLYPRPRRSRQHCCCWPPGCWASWPMPGGSVDKKVRRSEIDDP